MIRINKPKQAPENLIIDGKKRCISHCIAYDDNLKNPKKPKKKINFDSKVYGHSDVKEALIKSQNAKCCYCECKIYENEDIEHFRPKQAYRQFPGQPRQWPGYYWLAYEWDNLYLACKTCNQKHKNDLFPLYNPEDRAKNHQADLNKEKPILIDPGKENPSDFIKFQGEFAIGIDEEGRGKATIELLQLNRKALKESRKNKLIKLQKEQKNCKRLQDLLNVLNDTNQKPEITELITKLIEEIDQITIRINQSISPEEKFSEAIKCAFDTDFEFVLGD